MAAGEPIQRPVCSQELFALLKLAEASLPSATPDCLPLRVQAPLQLVMNGFSAMAQTSTVGVFTRSLALGDELLLGSGTPECLVFAYMHR